MIRVPEVIDQEIRLLVSGSRSSAALGEMEEAWAYLEDAHILSQKWAILHIRVHVEMLAMGVRTRDFSEVAGQLFRLAVAAPGSLAGRYPVGNSGRSNVSAFEPSPIRADLAEMLATADRH